MGRNPTNKITRHLSLYAIAKIVFLVRSMPPSLCMETPLSMFETFSGQKAKHKGASLRHSVSPQSRVRQRGGDIGGTPKWRSFRGAFGAPTPYCSPSPASTSGKRCSDPLQRRLAGFVEGLHQHQCERTLVPYPDPGCRPRGRPGCCSI